MLLSINNVAKSFGVDEILSAVSFRLDQREKVALVGPNGAGKTTLLKIITGQMEPDRGSVNVRPGAKIGYLRQDVPVSIGRTVLEEAQSGVSAQLELRKRLEELEALLEEGNPDVVDEYSLLHEHFMEAEGYSVEHDVRTVLLRMGFAEDEFSRQTGVLSGGEKTRLALARLLLEEPDLLILDEPTNHLDLQATEWIENWIRGYHGSVLLVSHDRTFLDNTAERVIELRAGTTKAYPGPFEKYLQLRADEELRQAEVAKRQEQEIAKLDEYVRRFMNSQRTAQARGRLKRLDRIKAAKVDAPTKGRVMKAAFGESVRSGDQVLEAAKLEIGYGDERLVGPFDWSVRLGDRWGIIGENGVGKSTLLKVLIDEVDPLAGAVRIGSNVQPGVFFQDASDMDPEQSPLDLLVWEEDMLPADARNLLGRFLITGDDVYRPIKTLSGGERNKLSLAKLTRLNPNLLILDEPTNHLDMDSRQALANILEEYKGTLILVSHDRWLLSQVTSHTLDLRRKEVIQYPGSYAEYRARQLSGRPMSAGQVASKPAAGPALNPRELSKELQRAERALEILESQIAVAEAQLKELEATLASLGSGEDVWELSRRHESLRQDIDTWVGDWESESIRLEALRAKQGKAG